LNFHSRHGQFDWQPCDNSILTDPNASFLLVKMPSSQEISMDSLNAPLIAEELGLDVDGDKEKRKYVKGNPALPVVKASSMLTGLQERNSVKVHMPRYILATYEMTLHNWLPSRRSRSKLATKALRPTPFES
jgi:hypothetical protein